MSSNTSFSTTTVIVIIISAIVILYTLMMSFDIVPGLGTCGVNCVSGKGPNEPFVAPVDYHYETEYSGKVLGVDKKQRPLYTKKVYVPQGTPNALRPRDVVGDVYPEPTVSVDGTETAPKSMFMFAQNQCLPECCPSSYSCSGGCVCVTQKQAEYIANRGNNNTIPQYAML
jgi:hypothetical protein